MRPRKTDKMEDGSEESWHDANEDGWETQLGERLRTEPLHSKKKRRRAALRRMRSEIDMTED